MAPFCWSHSEPHHLIKNLYVPLIVPSRRQPNDIRSKKIEGCLCRVRVRRCIHSGTYQLFIRGPVDQCGLEVQSWARGIMSRARGKLAFGSSGKTNAITVSKKIDVRIPGGDTPALTPPPMSVSSPWMFPPPTHRGTLLTNAHETASWISAFNE
jgi:hypothetical protein